MKIATAPTNTATAIPAVATKNVPPDHAPRAEDAPDADLLAGRLRRVLDQVVLFHLAAQVEQDQRPDRDDDVDRERRDEQEAVRDASTRPAPAGTSAPRCGCSRGGCAGRTACSRASASTRSNAGATSGSGRRRQTRQAIAANSATAATRTSRGRAIERQRDAAAALDAERQRAGDEEQRARSIGASARVLATAASAASTSR